MRITSLPHPVRRTSFRNSTRNSIPCFYAVSRHVPMFFRTDSTGISAASKTMYIKIRHAEALPARHAVFQARWKSTINKVLLPSYPEQKILCSKGRKTTGQRLPILYTVAPVILCALRWTSRHSSYARPHGGHSLQKLSMRALLQN